MKPWTPLSDRYANFRLVGVITIGISRLPILGFGYPDKLDIGESAHERIADVLGGTHTSLLRIESLSNDLDRVTWSVTSTEADSAPATLFSVQLELPMTARTEAQGTSLFIETVRTDMGFAAALTVNQLTHLAFYDILSSDFIRSQNERVEITGRLSKYVSGPAVPILRSIEQRYQSPDADRNIEIRDEDLGIIYKSFAGLV